LSTLLKRDESPTPRFYPETPLNVVGGSDELRSKYLLDVFNEVTNIVNKKERRKRRLLKEARRLQRETEE